MACNTLQNTKDKLKLKGLITSPTHNIEPENVSDVESLIATYQKTATEKYGLDGELFEILQISTPYADGTGNNVRYRLDYKVAEFDKLNTLVDNYNTEQEELAKLTPGVQTELVFESKKNFEELSGKNTNNQFGREFPEDSIDDEKVYDYSDEIKNVLFQGNIKNTTAKVVLQNILNSGIYQNDPKKLELIHRMMISTKASVKLVNGSELVGDDTYMQYNATTQDIQMAADNLGQVNSVEEGVSKFLHEVFHDRTIRVLKIPKNSSEQSLRRSLDDTYQRLRESLEVQFPHEMSSLEEFTAAMFSNKEFEAQVALLVNTNTSFWDTIKNFFRQLFSLDSSYDSLLNDLISLVDVTDEQFSTDVILESKYKYGDSKIIKSKKKLENLNDNIENTLDNLSKVTERLDKDSNFKTRFKDVKLEIEKLLEIYERDSNEYKIESIKILNHFITGQFDAADKRLGSIDKITTNTYEQLRTYVTTFNSLEKVIKGSLEELRTADAIEMDEFNSLYNQTNDLISRSNRIQDKLMEYASDFIKNKSDLFSDQYKDVYFRYENKFRNEGKKKGYTKSALDDYVNKQLSENRELIQAESKDEFNDLLSSSITDISQLSAIVNSEKDFNHPIIRIFSRILDGVKQRYQSIIQPKMLEIQAITEKFLEGRRLESSDKVYDKMIDWSKDDEGYLVGEYQIGFKDSFNQLLDDVKKASTTNLKTISVQDINLNSLKKGDKTISTRTSGSHNYQKDDIVDVLVKGSNAGVSVKINKIISYSNFKNLSQSKKDSFAKNMGDYLDFDDFIKKNKYVANSKLAKTFPEIYNFINNNGSIDIISYEKVTDLNNNELLQIRNKIFKKWFKENTIKNQDDITKPHPKWLTDTSKMTDKEKSYLRYIKELAETSNKNYGIGAKSLKSTLMGATFYRLPSQHKELITHIKNNDLLKYGKEALGDTFKLREDDTDFGETMTKRNGKTEYMVYTDLSGKEIKYVPIHHRGKIERKSQSTDLATLYAMEFQNSVKFNEKSKVNSELKMFIDVISENDFVKRKGVGLRWVVGAKSELVTYKKEDANLLKLLETMMNNRVYDKTKEYVGKIGSVDVSKLEGFVRGVTSRAGMALNVIGAPVNLITGKTQTLLENLRDPNLNLGNIKKAETYFRKNIGGTIDDLGRNVYKSLPNQILFNFGGIMGADIIQNSFEKNKALALTNTKWMYMMQEGGEHWIQSVHTMSILDAAKILDKDGNYLTKDGKITNKEGAASVLDILSIESGVLSPKFKGDFYTTLDRMKTYGKGGEATLRSYIQASLIKSQGNYSQEYQAEMQRHMLGTMLMHFKKHIISPGLSRFRGFATNAFANEEDVHLLYDSDLQRIDEGNYTTWVRYLTKSFLPKLNTFKLLLISKNLREEWNNMDDWEKGNIQKTMSEIAFVALATSSALLFAGAASDDDDYDALWYAAAITRRLQSDALQYVDITEAWRLVKNPISSINFLERTTHVVGSLTNYVTPFIEGREDKAINALKGAAKMIPGKAVLTNPHDAYGFVNR